MPAALPFELKDVPWPLGGDDPWQWLALYPETTPLVLLGGKSSAYSLFALAWDSEDVSEFLASPLPQARAASPVPFTVGTLGLLSYDGFSPHPAVAKAAAPHVLLRLRRTLVLDHGQKRAFLSAETGWEAAAFQVPLPWEIPAREDKAATAAVPLWRSSWSDSRYLKEVAEVIEEIRAGRFYQLNLLRYWEHHGTIARSSWAARARRWGGPFSAYLGLPELSLVSLSPERFFRCEARGGDIFMQTEPIKGTRPVVAKPEANAAAREELAHSPKDRAELSMIVDLMRNDLHRVSCPGSVKVLDPGSVHSFPNVHHLIARIEGRLRAELDWGSLLSALCPGGSITGAPKREVMLAIAEREQRARGYFMGKLLYADAYSGHVDSSILIRTAVARAPEHWEFAAGSGIVVHSQPAEELAEVLAKAQVVLGELG